MEGSAGRPFAELVGSVAEATPAPGGGSAVAWAGALAAALVEMTAAFVNADEVSARARELQSGLIAAGERELTAYRPVLDAARLPADDPSRAERLESALEAASESPLAIARNAAELAELGVAVAGLSTPALVGDAVSGVLLAEASGRAAARMVEINLAGRSHDRRVTEARALAARAQAARRQVIGDA